MYCSSSVELGYSYKLPGSRIPCMVTSFLHVLLAGVELGYFYKLPGSQTPCMGTAFLHVLLAAVMAERAFCNRYDNR